MFFLSLNLIKEYEVPQSVLSDLVKYAIKKSTSAGMRGSDHAWEFAELAAELASSEDEQQIKKMIVALKKEGKGNDFIETVFGRTRSKHPSSLFLQQQN